jgi:glutathione-regulated potassium-efflux system ancillary protein KefG
MSKTRVLLLFAHPRYEDSIINRSLVEAVRDLEGLTFHDLYEAYPDFDINIPREQELLLRHDVIIWHHPFYWYSCPPLLKQWIDLVLEYGWAYGRNGTALEDKIIFNCISAGGGHAVYQSSGRNRFTINEFIRPFEQTAMLCHMKYLPPFVVHQANAAGPDICQSFAISYKQLLENFITGTFDAKALQARTYLNEHQYS